MKKRALIAMSGGVDSSVCAYLAEKAGYECIGATMLLCDTAEAVRDAEDAKKICDILGIEHHTFDMRQEFSDIVKEYFVTAYENGKTPNPCILCNKKFKFGALMYKADELSCDKIVTGHYARVDSDGTLKKAMDISKDQSYVLWSLSKEVLARCYFPLGEITKAEAREIALREGFVTARKSDSQDICFVPDGDYASFIKNYRKKDYPEGDFVTPDGKILGRHKGIINYTVGQRKGLGLACGVPVYVKEILPRTNEVVISSNEDLFTDTVYLEEFNLIMDNYSDIKAKIRYNQKEQPCRLTIMDKGEAVLLFDEKQRAAAKGQSAVIYCGDAVVGGGIIK